MRAVLLAGAILALCSMPARAVDRKAVDAAIERGVGALKRMQRPDGTWNHPDIGATALAGLTLIECGIAKTDKAVKDAADKVRKESYSLTHTYSLAMSVIFLEGLGEPTDTPLIESMLVRLLAGQLPNGAWPYYCPAIAADEARRLQAEASGRVLKGGRDLEKMPTVGKRTVKDLAPAIQAQLRLIGQGGNQAGAMGGGDNSNTQFALLGLWVGRRFGVPTQGALVKAAQYFRATQTPGGAWSYMPSAPGMAAMMTSLPGGGPSPTMTCAGVLGLAYGHGSALDGKKNKDSKAATHDISGDKSMKAALQALSETVGQPVGWDGSTARPAAIAPMSGKGYYYLWSLERVAVGLKLETIGKKDWYEWGAELLLANQNAGGDWQGDFGTCGADTCFALLFLKRANLTRDLTSGLAGLKDPGKILRAGGVGGDALRTAPPDLDKTGIGKKAAPGDKKPVYNNAGAKPPRVVIPSTLEKTPRTAEEKAAATLGDDLVKATSERRAEVLKQMRDTRGVAYTEALVGSISRLDGEARKDARVALAERLTRMKPDTLREYLSDDEPEIRRAAALATAAKKNRSHVPDLIRQLSDREPLVQRAALHALKKLTDQDFGPDDEATVTQRKEAVAAWLKWWQANSRE